MFEGNKVAIPQVTHEDQNQLTTWYTEHAVKFIEQNKDRPFFLYLAHNMPHVPLHVSDKFRGKTERGLYGDVIEEIDWSVGQVMDALKRTGPGGEDLGDLHLGQRPVAELRRSRRLGLSLARGQGHLLGRRHPRAVHHALARQDPRRHRESSQMLMTIDLFPTIAKLIHADLPKHPIDGLDVWPIISGKRGAKNPHAAYWFYYEANQLQAVVSGDGRWKLQLPHTYRTLGGQPGGPRRHARPLRAAQDRAGRALRSGERHLPRPPMWPRQHPDIVKRLEAEAEKARQELGDALIKQTGKGVREPGRVAQQ